MGVIAPAGVVDEAALRRGVEVLTAAGFAVRVGDAVLARERYLAGDDESRAADWRAMMRDSSVRAVFCARGGYGSGRLLPLLDARDLRRDPKPVVGHSDVTYLLAHVVDGSGVVGFHGPMVSWFAERPESTAGLLALLAGAAMPVIEAEESWRDGEAEGAVVGGCLSIVAAMAGTPWALETRGRLLFLEDVNERPYRVDRMLTQLRQAGAFDGIAGLIFGEMPNSFDGQEVSLADVALDVCRGDYPIVAGVPSGHGRGLLTLPFGVPARLRGRRLEFLEAAVQAR